jgi:uncharacterized protein YajQ (UPF0234 family)
MPSFDVVSKLEMHEVDNAVQQAKKEVGQRYDFRGTNTIIDKSDEGISIRSDGEGRVDAALDVLRGKLAKRKVSLLALDAQPVQPAAGKGYRQLIKLKQGVEKEKAKEIVKTIKNSKMKLQASIQGDLVRVTGKKRDDLQAAIALLKEADLGLPLQFENFRD